MPALESVKSKVFSLCHPLLIGDSFNITFRYRTKLVTNRSSKTIHRNRFPFINHSQVGHRP